MTYPMTKQDREIQERARAFVDEELIPLEVEAELNDGELAPGVRDKLAQRARDIGFAAINMPKELGGDGFTMLQQVLVQEQVGRVTNGVAWVIHTPAAWFPAVAGMPDITRSRRSRSPAAATTAAAGAAGSSLPPSCAQAAGMRFLLPSGSTRTTMATPRSRSRPQTGRSRPCSGCPGLTTRTVSCPAPAGSDSPCALPVTAGSRG